MKAIADTGLIVALLNRRDRFHPWALDAFIRFAPPMDLADACLVRMAELSREVKVWTVDRADFSIYRRNGRDGIPCEFPPDKE